MSNLVHRRRRCARIVLYTILCLEGSTPEDWELLTSQRISLWLQGSLFCTAKGSYFVFWGPRRSCRQDWELRHRAAAKTRLEQRPMTEGPRRYAS